MTPRLRPILEYAVAVLVLGGLVLVMVGLVWCDPVMRW